MLQSSANFGYPAVDAQGVKEVVSTSGPYKGMLMDVHVYQMAAGETRRFAYENEEAAFLLLQGAVEFTWPGRTEAAARTDAWENGASCLHVCRGTKVAVTATAASEVLVQRTANPAAFEAVYYTPEAIRMDTFGQNLCGGVAVREVTTIFDYASAPYSNMVLGEIFNHQGSWSSYTPHSHPQPEVYYYRFDKPQGFGACFIGDEAHKITHGSFAAIPGGLTHPQVAAPGYRMTYVWMIRHLDGNPWTSRDDDAAHTWMLGKEF